jgi:hypothetical protein
MMFIQHHKASEYSDRALDQFEQIYADSAKSARIMALVVHPYIMGAPHRLKYFRNVLETIHFRYLALAADNAALQFSGHCFAQFVEQHECALVGHAQIAGEGQGAFALHFVEKIAMAAR